MPRKNNFPYLDRTADHLLPLELQDDKQGPAIVHGSNSTSGHGRIELRFYKGSLLLTAHDTYDGGRCAVVWLDPGNTKELIDHLTTRHAALGTAYMAAYGEMVADMAAGKLTADTRGYSAGGQAYRKSLGKVARVKPRRKV